MTHAVADFRCDSLLGVCRRGARTSAKPSSTPPNGRDLSRDLRKAIKEGVESFKARHGYPPHLAVVTVGTRPPAEARRYVRWLLAHGLG